MLLTAVEIYCTSAFIVFDNRGTVLYTAVHVYLSLTNSSQRSTLPKYADNQGIRRGRFSVLVFPGQLADLSARLHRKQLPGRPGYGASMLCGILARLWWGESGLRPGPINRQWAR